MIKILESFEDCFNRHKTGVFFYDDILNPKESDYMKFEKGTVGHLEKMTADDYFRIISDKVFGVSVEQSKRGLSQSKIDKYAEMMKEGTVFNLPYINLHPYFGPSQEGRHRMLAMAKAFGDDAEGYVLIVEPYEPDDKEIYAYAEKKFIGDGEWGSNYINSVLDKYLMRDSEDDEEEDSESQEDDYYMIDGISLGDGDIIDLGDGWARIDKYEIDRYGLNLYATVLSSGREVEYYVNDEDQVKIKRN